MNAKVIDTNVAVVANGRDTHASAHCQEAAINLLTAMHRKGPVVIDDLGDVLAEYGKRLRPQGQPGVGDLFYRHVLDNQGNGSAVIQVSPAGNGSQALTDAFQNGNLAAFDLDDRVFALVAVVAGAPVATATDSDWPQHDVGLAACGVRVDYVCGRAVAAQGGHN